ncbi:MAG: hypothetical protein ACI93H_000153, partial [Psychromonas sp.]
NVIKNLISVVLSNRFDLRLSRFRGAHYRDFDHVGKGLLAIISIKYANE